MTAWTLIQCVYLAAGGILTPAIVVALFTPERRTGSFGAPVPTFIIVIGVLLLWPMLVLLIATEES